MNKKLIKVVQLFEEYPIFYQPYIKDTVEELIKNNTISLTIKTFKNSKIDLPYVKSFKNYKRRKWLDKFYRIFKNKSYLAYSLNKYNIIHLQHSFLHSKLKSYYHKQNQKKPKIIVTLRGGDTYIKPWIDNKWKFFYQENETFIDAFITMSNHQKEYLNIKWGISLDKIHVIPISFGKPFNVKAKYPNKNKINIISIFRLSWEKNINGNLLFIKTLSKEGYNLNYDIYGDGPEMGKLFFLVDKYNLRGIVNIKGKLENDDLKVKLKEYDFLLQLSHSEAFPTTVIEAQSHGVPVIVSNSGGLPESLVDNETGYILDENNIENTIKSLIALWNNEELYFNFSKRAIAFSHSNFSTNQEVAKLLKLYDQLIEFPN